MRLLFLTLFVVSLIACKEATQDAARDTVTEGTSFTEATENAPNTETVTGVYCNPESLSLGSVISISDLYDLEISNNLPFGVIDDGHAPSMHNGIDFSSQNTVFALYAPTEAIVEKVLQDVDELYINLQSGNCTMGFHHIEQIQVSEGDTVAEGELLGYSQAFESGSSVHMQLQANLGTTLLAGHEEFFCPVQYFNNSVASEIRVWFDVIKASIRDNFLNSSQQLFRDLGESADLVGMCYPSDTSQATMPTFP